MLNLESLPLRIECFDISNLRRAGDRGVDGRVRAGRAEEGRLPHLRDRPRAGAGRLRVDVARPCGAGSRGSRTPTRPTSGYDPGFASVPNLVVIDGGKGQLSAALRRAGRPRPAARRGDRPREARSRRCSCPAGPTRSCLPPDSPGAAAAAAHPRRGAPLRAQAPPRAGARSERHRLAVRPPARRRPGSQAGAAGALRLARRRARRDRRRAGGRARPAAEDGARDPRVPEQDRRRGRTRERLVLGGLRGARLGHRRDGLPRRRARSTTSRPRRSTGAGSATAHAGAARAGRPARRVLRGRARDVRGLRPRADPGVGRRDAVRGACLRELQQVPYGETVSYGDLARAGRAATARTARPARSARAVPLDRRAVSPRDPRRWQHRRVGPGGQRLQASGCSATRACTCEGPADRLPRRRHRPVDGPARPEGASVRSRPRS